jgi:hypothetical protein
MQWIFNDLFTRILLAFGASLNAILLSKKAIPEHNSYCLKKQCSATMNHYYKKMENKKTWV